MAGRKTTHRKAPESEASHLVGAVKPRPKGQKPMVHKPILVADVQFVVHLPWDLAQKVHARAKKKNVSSFVALEQLIANALRNDPEPAPWEDQTK